ncbi:hypothetical protein GALMADRAFT_236130, partial [Galerina marginata CBS 339.88]
MGWLNDSAARQSPMDVRLETQKPFEHQPTPSMAGLWMGNYLYVLLPSVLIPIPMQSHNLLDRRGC